MRVALARVSGKVAGSESEANARRISAVQAEG
jgi:hypothetical protein